jgi:hypothetical protein
MNLIRRIFLRNKFYSCLGVLVVFAATTPGQAEISRSSLVSFCWSRLIGRPSEEIYAREIVEDARREMRALVDQLKVRDAQMNSALDYDDLLKVWTPVGQRDSFIRSSSSAYDVANRLWAFRKLRGLQGFVVWEGHIHGHWGNAKRNDPNANMIWGHVFNVRSADILLVGMTQETFTNLTFFDFLVGPFDPTTFVVPSFEWAKTARSKIDVINIRGSSYLWARRLALNYSNMSVYESFIRQIQDLH